MPRQHSIIQQASWRYLRITTQILTTSNVTEKCSLQQWFTTPLSGHDGVRITGEVFQTRQHLGESQVPRDFHWTAKFVCQQIMLHEYFHVSPWSALAPGLKDDRIATFRTEALVVIESCVSLEPCAYIPGCWGRDLPLSFPESTCSHFKAMSSSLSPEGRIGYMWQKVLYKLWVS